MKYTDFYNYLMVKLGSKAYIGPSISIHLYPIVKISMSKQEIQNNHKYIIFPVKIYGENINHFNVLLLDNKLKVIERYEPFNEYLNNEQINDLLEPLLYKLMEQKIIYFLRYSTTLNQETILSSKNCGHYCVKYLVNRISKIQ